ncbi:hypothetical protein [Nodularia sphaerocarpa]|uniref:hypothetical protein n=1 Tax=Nodularia sphaerocarpa TaxID=137816 RepID=UPI001EFB7855|nr:hypothetical protein [Nodularia sphaerocarpa]MDB9374175.1 hypothetical protein [Nodularia sphaerocarpa CS-585]MDB9376259.1 hypothetical protein [Nodularia sphaerocarpa CS-585A2]ULP71292.1 hypothetical protein BDGGKGIB_00918 [Nodularia sphaerocarpa UHCC 0038]
MIIIKDFYPIIQVLPAIIGFLITGLFILTFVHGVKIPESNETPPGVIMSSFIFIASGFIFQIIYSHWSSIQCWAKHNSSISFVFTILGTFSINRFLKKLADDKEKREIAVLFRNSIDAQVRSLQFIKKYLSFISPKECINYIQIYKSDLINSKSYDTALNKVGIYDEKDIDIISQYSIQLQQCLNYLERLLIEIELNEDMKVKRTYINQTNYQPQYKRTIIIVRIVIITTSLLGIFTSYYLSKRYLNKNLEKLQNEFFDDYEKILDSLKELLIFSDYYIMNKDFFSDLLNKLKYIRNNFIETSNNFNAHERKPIYLYRLLIKELVADFDIDIYTGKILPKVYISDEEDIVTFGESPEDAKNKCNSIIDSLKKKHHLKEEIINKLKKEIENPDIIPEIVSPWN